MKSAKTRPAPLSKQEIRALASYLASPGKGKAKTTSATALEERTRRERTSTDKRRKRRCPASSFFELKRRIACTNLRSDEELLGSLNDREKEIVYDRFVNGKSLREIANKFSVTRQRIHQIETRALRKINRSLWRANEAEFIERSIGNPHWQV